MRLCKNCKYYSAKEYGRCNVAIYNSLLFDPVTGNTLTATLTEQWKMTARDMRLTFNLCGIEGKLYEEK